MSQTLVTGAQGSIGRALMKLLPDAVGIDIWDWDIRYPWSGPDYFKPNVVFHLAAAKDAPEGEVDPNRVLQVNATGTANVLRRWPGARVILASTCKACVPETVYGASKLIAERLVLNAGGSVARFHNVVETHGNVFEKWAALEDRPLPVTDCSRYFIHVDQATDLLVSILGLAPGRYLIDPGSIERMVDIANRFYPGREVVHIPRRRGDRAVEPLVAPHEILLPTDIERVLKVVSPHD